MTQIKTNSRAPVAHGGTNQNPEMLANHTGGDAWGFTRDYVYIAHADKMYNLRSGQYVRISAVERLYQGQVGGRDEIREGLLEGPYAVEKVHAVTFRPGAERFVVEGHCRHLNLWRPTELQPIEGDVAPFLQHIVYIFDGDEEAINYVLNYLAHLVQRPGQKIPAAILLTGRQGTGKSLIARIVRKMVGEHNSNMLSPIDLMSQFNSFIERSIVTVVEEMTLDERKGTAARLKAWITEPETYVNRKGIPQYKVPNQTHFFVLSNDASPLIIDSDDRRFFVWNSKATPQDAAYYTALTTWLEGSGYGHVLHFLLSRDISGFNSYLAPPRTEARSELIRSGQSDIASFLYDTFDADDAPFDRDLVAVHDIMRAASDAGLRAKPREISEFLKNTGATPLGQKRFGNQKVRIWAVRNHEHWNGATEKEIAAAYRGVMTNVRPHPVRRSAASPMRRQIGASENAGGNSGSADEIDAALCPPDAPSSDGGG